MDFRQKNLSNTNREIPNQQVTSPTSGGVAPSPHRPTGGGGDGNGNGNGKFRFKERASSPLVLNLLGLLVLVGSALLILGAAFFITRVSSVNDRERGFVKQNQYQAVFLNNGQVYFGHIEELNARFVNLTNVYYLTQGAATQEQQQSSDYTLVKLGCQQIHHPEDKMLINRDQVTFWENLDKSGKVAKSIEEFKKQNPKGENCQEVTNQTQSAPAPTQSGNNSAQTTTPTTNPANNNNTSPAAPTNSSNRND